MYSIDCVCIFIRKWKVVLENVKRSENCERIVMNSHGIKLGKFSSLNSRKFNLITKQKNQTAQNVSVFLLFKSIFNWQYKKKKNLQTFCLHFVFIIYAFMFWDKCRSLCLFLLMRERERERDLCFSSYNNIWLSNWFFLQMIFQIKQSYKMWNFIVFFHLKFYIMESTNL